jgi:hypothetical protein
LQVEAIAQPRERTPASLVEGLPFPNDSLKTIREHCADGSPLLGGNHTSLPEEIGVKFECDVRFHGCTMLARCSRAAQFNVPNVDGTMTDGAPTQLRDAYAARGIIRRSA